MTPGLKFSLFAIALALAAAGGYLAGGLRGDGHAGHTAVPASTADATPGERKILYYRNPMGLPDTSPVPKKDSMGMDYLPVYEGEDQDDGAVAVNPARMQALGVRVARAERRVLEQPVRAVGRVEVDERRIHDVAPRFEGWIEQLHVSAVGDPVRAGQPLFTVYAPELASAAEEQRIADTLAGRLAGGDDEARAAAERLAGATRERLANWQMHGGGTARRSFAAPVSGVVLEREAVAGMRFEAGRTLLRIADLSSVWVLAEVYEHDLARVRPGQPATVRLDAWPGEDFAATVDYLYPTVDPATRSARVRLRLPNADGRLRPGQFARVHLATGEAAPVLAVPDSAVLDGGERQSVLVEEGEGRFRPQAVRIGRRDPEWVEILDGLEDGARVVVAANFLIDAESNLRAALAGFTAGEQRAPAYRATGTLDELYDDGSVSLSHAPIAELDWPAMTMEFTLAAPGLADGIAPGSAVRFEFEARGPGEYVVTHIEAGHGAEH
ncbi:efflux RND transporter periplasmic adaptor subunit [Pseudothauera nasutitermitis]|uniref:Efflux RND transporter periplasmic adaptor subunit n=1 Tax=Pseudothauera nasutitermitis TaxID=2565930 RepID=A0A4S4ANE7_9RHOO|nr:efflux RND transporter periplasmic adaptor subunit [Pseudothauera nasutitermitis]THF61138.1 efflux RND transporter periplasmic adaptor subunit [Pseudothauera nasutitermitis]